MILICYFKSLKFFFLISKKHSSILYHKIFLIEYNRKLKIAKITKLKKCRENMLIRIGKIIQHSKHLHDGIIIRDVFYLFLSFLFIFSYNFLYIVKLTVYIDNSAKTESNFPGNFY